MAPLRLPFPKWYNANIRCDYHVGNPSHLIENCSSLKHEVQSLIKDKKLKFEESDGSVGVEDSFKEEADITRQEREAPREANSVKTKMPRDKVPIAKIKRNETGCSSTTEGSKKESAPDLA